MLALVLVLLTPGRALSNPIISNTSGTLTHGATITISGSGFGTKVPAAPLKWDDFESGSLGASLSTGGWKTTVSNHPNPSDSPPVFDNTRSWGQGSQSGYADISTGGDNAAYLDGLNLTKVYASYRLYYTMTWDGVGAQNQKGFRVHANDGPNIFTSYPAIFEQMFAEGGHRLTIRPCDGSGCGDNAADYTPATIPSDSWHRIEHWWVLSDPSGSETGSAEYWRDNGADYTIFPDPTRPTEKGITLSAGVNKRWQLVMLPFFFGNGNTGHIWYDDVYIDITRARVEIGDAPTWSASNQRAIQIPSVWSDTSITITVNQDSIPDLNNSYLYIVDPGGNVNANGFPLTGSSPDLPPNQPTGLVVK